jgi:iron(III) transport system substrate-binding protein
MKKGITIVAIITLIATMLGFKPVAKAAGTTTVQIFIGATSGYVNGKIVTLDQAPLITNGRTMVPLRFVSESLGATVDWNASTREVIIKLSNNTVILKIDSTTATVNGNKVTLDVPATIVKKTGRTIVPIRFVSESLGADVTWDDTNKSVTIKYNPDWANCKTVTVYTANTASEVGKYFSEFEKHTGIHIQYVRLSTGDLFARIEAEKDNPKASVLFGGSVESLYIPLKKDGILEAYKSPGFADIPEQFKDKDGFWTGLGTNRICFVTNSKLAKEKGINPPQSWSDLLKPEYKGLIALSHPASSGTGYEVLSTVVQLMGEDEAFKYFKQLNIPVYQKSGVGPLQLVALGEAVVNVNCTEDALDYIGQGYPLVITLPQEGTGYEINGIALIKNGPPSEYKNAKKMIDWFTSKEGMEIFVGKSEAPRIPTRPDVPVPPEMEPYKQAKLIKYDMEWSAVNKKRLVDRFRNEIAPAP